MASASIRLLSSYDWQASLKRLEAGLLTGLEPCRASGSVADVRVLGAIGVVEMHRPVDMAEIQKQLVDKGVWVRPFGRLVYLMPPYIMLDRELEILTAAVCDVVKAIR